MKKKTYNQPSIQILTMHAQPVLVNVSKWDPDGTGRPIKPGNPEGGLDSKENSGNLWSDDDQDWD